MSPKEQKNIFVDKRGTKLKPQKRQIIDILIVIATTYLLHRKINNLDIILLTRAAGTKRSTS